MGSGDAVLPLMSAGTRCTHTHHVKHALKWKSRPCYNSCTYTADQVCAAKQTTVKRQPLDLLPLNVHYNMSVLIQRH